MLLHASAFGSLKAFLRAFPLADRIFFGGLFSLNFCNNLKALYRLEWVTFELLQYEKKGPIWQPQIWF